MWFFFFKQKTAYEMRISDWSSDVCSSDLLGFVGEPSHIDRSLLDTISAAGMIPVVAPIGIGDDGHTYNINADTMAGAVAAALGAARLFLLTDVPGVLDKQGELLTDLPPQDIGGLRAAGTREIGREHI